MQDPRGGLDWQAECERLLVRMDEYFEYPDEYPRRFHGLVQRMVHVARLLGWGRFSHWDERFCEQPDYVTFQEERNWELRLRP